MVNDSQSQSPKLVYVAIFVLKIAIRKGEWEMSKSIGVAVENVKAAGTITIQFVANISGEKLMEDFADFFVKYGKVELTNMNGEVAMLDIHSHEVTYLDDES